MHLNKCAFSVNCKLTGDTAVSKVYLGQPWRPNAKTVFIHTQMGSHIVTEGWNPGKAMPYLLKKRNLYYTEYNSIGQGAPLGKRALGQSS
jgi:pectinesterase